MDDRFEKDSMVFKKPDEFDDPNPKTKWDGIAVEDYMLRALRANRADGKFVATLIKYCPKSWAKALEKWEHKK